MKRKTIFIVLVAMMAVAFSCAKEETALLPDEVTTRYDEHNPYIDYCQLCGYWSVEDGVCFICLTGHIWCEGCGNWGPGAGFLCNRCRYGTPHCNWIDNSDGSEPRP